MSLIEKFGRRESFEEVWDKTEWGREIEFCLIMLSLRCFQDNQFKISNR